MVRGGVGVADVSLTANFASTSTPRRAAYSIQTWTMGRRAVDALDFVLAAGFADASTASSTSMGVERESVAVGNGKMLRFSGRPRSTSSHAPLHHAVTVELTDVMKEETRHAPLDNTTLSTTILSVAPFSCV